MSHITGFSQHDAMGFFPTCYHLFYIGLFPIYHLRHTWYSPICFYIYICPCFFVGSFIFTFTSSLVLLLVSSSLYCIRFFLHRVKCFTNKSKSPHNHTFDSIVLLPSCTLLVETFHKLMSDNHCFSK